MLLENKTAIIYGAGGAVGGAVARAFAREGARVFVTGHHRDNVLAVAKAISDEGGAVDAAHVDALDERNVEDHATSVVNKAGGIDISFNAAGIPQPGIQGISLAELSVDSFLLPITSYARSHFLTARAAVRRMLPRGKGVILMHTPEPARLGAPLIGGMGPAWAAMEALSRDLSAELASRGIRTVCLRSTGLPDTATIDVVFGLHAKALGIGRDDFRALMEAGAHTRRSTTLAELASVAAFVASDRASGMTGAVANLTGGKLTD